VNRTQIFIVQRPRYTYLQGHFVFAGGALGAQHLSSPAGHRDSYQVVSAGDAISYKGDCAPSAPLKPLS
jgi:hypothetical protein